MRSLVLLAAIGCGFKAPDTDGDSVPVDTDSGLDAEPCIDDLFDGLPNECDPTVADVCVGEPLCDAGGCILDVGVQTHTLTGTLLYDGSAIGPSRTALDWRLRFVDTRDGTTYGHVQRALPTYTASIFPGTYDVYAHLENGHVALPARRGGFLVSRGLQVQGDMTFNVGMYTHTVTGTITYNGGPIPAGSYWTIELTSTETDSVFVYDFYSEGAYELGAPTGTYAVTVTTRSEGLPPGSIQLSPGMQIAADTTLDADLVSVNLSGSATYGGQPIPASGDGHDWTLLLWQGDTPHRMMLPGEADWSTPMWPGDWAVDVELSHDERPYAGRTRVAEQTLSTDTVLDIDIPLATLSGSVQYNGRTIGVSDLIGWQLLVIDTATQTETAIDMPGNASSYAVTVPQGTYDIFLQVESHPVPEPVAGPFLVATGLNVTGDTTLDIAPRTIKVDGEVSYNGEAIPDGPGPDYRISFVDPVTGRAIWEDRESTEPFEMDIFPGTYDIHFELREGLVASPAEGIFVVGSAVELTQSTRIDISPTTRTLSGSMVWDGGSVESPVGGPASGTADIGDWYLVLENLEHGWVSTPAIRTPGDYEIAVYPGAYDVRFSLWNGQVDTPVYGERPLGACYELR